MQADTSKIDLFDIWSECNQLSLNSKKCVIKDGRKCHGNCNQKTNNYKSLDSWLTQRSRPKVCNQSIVKVPLDLESLCEK